MKLNKMNLLLLSAMILTGTSNLYAGPAKEKFAAETKSEIETKAKLFLLHESIKTCRRDLEAIAAVVVAEKTTDSAALCFQIGSASASCYATNPIVEQKPVQNFLNSKEIPSAEINQPTRVNEIISASLLAGNLVGFCDPTISKGITSSYQLTRRQIDERVNELTVFDNRDSLLLKMRAIRIKTDSTLALLDALFPKPIERVEPVQPVETMKAPPKPRVKVKIIRASDLPMADPNDPFPFYAKPRPVRR